MTAGDTPFITLIKAVSQFVIPVFQRDYSWKANEHCAQLWRDVLRASSRRSERKHFVGAIVGIDDEDSPRSFVRYFVVDGQQRLTTVMLLLTALRDHILRTKWTGVNGPTSEQIEDFLLNRHERGDKRYRLLLRNRDREVLNDLIDENPRRGKAPTIDRAYDFFVRAIGEEDADPAQIWDGIHRLEIVDTKLRPNVDDPQLIYESLNSTGLDLGKSDLIRNFILMGLREPKQTDLYRKYWSEIETLFRDRIKAFDDFARDYLDLKAERKEPTRQNRIYPDFRELWRDTVKDEEDELDAALADMVRHARHYAAFRLGKDDNPKRRERYECIRSRSTAPAITVMELLRYWESVDGFGESELIESLSLIESFLVRRAVCRPDSRSYGKVFAELTVALRTILNGPPATDDASETMSASPSSPLEALRAAFRLRPLGYDFPSDDEFRRTLQEANLYSKRVCRFLLERLQNHDNKEPVNTSRCSIEHILPQNPRLGPEWREMLGDDWQDVQDRWLHRLGNLTLTAHNSPLGDRPFQEKKERKRIGFVESSFGRLNRFVIDREIWDEDAMQQRTNELAESAISIWGPLPVD